MINILKHRNENLVRLYKYFLPYKGKIAVASIFLIATALTSSATATLLGKLTDVSFYQGGSWLVFALPAALIAVTLVFAISTVLSAYIMSQISQSVLVTLRKELFYSVLHWPESQYQKVSTGLISSKFVNESTIALSGAADSVTVMIRDTVQIIGLLCVLFWHDWILTLVTFVIGPALFIVLRLLSRKVKVVVKQSQETLGNMISRIQESYEAERIVKINDSYDFEDERFSKVNMRIRRLALKTNILQGLPTPLTQILTMVAVAFVVAVALIEAQGGALTFGQFVTFLSALLLIKAPVQHLAGLNSTFASISVAAKSIFDVIDAKPELDTGKKELKEIHQGIAFEDVHLRYPGQDADALKGISFTVKKGESIALVGQSGSGKTSIVNLLPRFLEVTGGKITIDGIDIRDYTLESLRSQMSLVSQDVFLFEDTIKNNITYGVKSSVTEEEIDAAIDAADLRGLVKSLPKGIDTSVGEGGKLLSGGQRQRISIARAILKNAPIIILDEATSALDSKSENEIKNALKNLTKGKISITVAHRLSTIEDCNRIYVISDGEIKEEGNHQSLLTENGIYAKLCKMQEV